MTLKYPFFLLLFLPALFFLLLSLRTRAKPKVLWFPVSQRNWKLGTHNLWPIWIPFLLKAIAFAALALVLARPQSSSSQTRRLAEGIDVMIALDVSQSMQIEDVSELDKNRLDVAKETVKKFIAGRTDDRIGFLAFSGEGITLCPPTLDYEFLLSSVDLARMNQLRDGTAIGDAIATAVNRLKESQAKTRIIILVTDGDNNMGAIAPLTAGDIAAGYGIKVYAIALGTEGIVNVPDMVNVFGVTRKVYRQTTSSINPTLLMKISEETGGKFFRATDDDSLERVFSEIDKLERNKVETKDRVLWNEHYQPFLWLALLFLLLDLILSRTIFRVLPD